MGLGDHGGLSFATALFEVDHHQVVGVTRRVGAALERQLGDKVQIRDGEEENLVRVDVTL